MAKVKFTADRIKRFTCPADKAQVFLWDETQPGLGLRATPNGEPAYVFQGRYQEKSVRVTIGSPHAWTIPQAEDKARALQREIDQGRDPRDVKRGALAAKQAQRDAEHATLARSVTVGEAWPIYLREGKPKRRDAWKDRYRADLEAMAAAGLTLGKPTKPTTSIPNKAPPEPRG